MKDHLPRGVEIEHFKTVFPRVNIVRVLPAQCETDEITGGLHFHQVSRQVLFARRVDRSRDHQNVFAVFLGISDAQCVGGEGALNRLGKDADAAGILGMQQLAGLIVQRDTRRLRWIIARH